MPLRKDNTFLSHWLVHMLHNSIVIHLTERLGSLPADISNRTLDKYGDRRRQLPSVSGFIQYVNP